MSFAYRFGYAALAATAASIWSAPVMGDGLP
jgi:hypothetical protein